MSNKFILELIQMMDEKVRDERLQNQLKEKAHIDNRCFKSDYVWKLSAAMLLRIFVNLAHLLGPDDFRDFFNDLREKVIDIANCHLEEFNDCHARQGETD